MPTRTDAQGLMACEMASFGIPLITSNIPVCHEIFDDFKNVLFINNDEHINLKSLIKGFKTDKVVKNSKYFQENTCAHEIEIFKEILK